jgi:DNA-binding transcriptional MocR family regulator
VAVRYQIAGSTAAQISESVEAGIRSGELGPGAALPPVRALAGQIGVAPATVAAAYKALRGRGVVETAGRNGTRVRPRPPVGGRVRAAAAPGMLDLSRGETDPALLPRLAEHLRALAAEADEPVGYSGSGPWPGLVAAARERLAADGVPESATVTVTSGALDAVERLLAAHLRPGDRVGLEDPSWGNLIDLVAALGLEAVPMPVDDDGPTVDGVRRALRAGAAAIVVTSRAQNPTGAAVTAARADALRRMLHGTEVLTIEDDHAAELAEVATAPLLGSSARWAFVRSASKPYGPDLRLAVVAGDEATVSRVEGRMRLGAGWVSTLTQRLVLRLWRDPAVADLVARAGLEYGRRRGALLDALGTRGVPAHGRTGINVWVPVDDEATAIATLRDRGIAVSPGSVHRLAAPPGLRITVAPLTGPVDAVADALAEARLRRAPVTSR